MPDAHAGPLNAVSTALVATTTATAALLTALGANSDRLWLMLDEDTTRTRLIIAFALAVLAVLAGLIGYFLTDGRQAFALLIGLACFGASLFFAIWAAATAADAASRPGIVDLSVTTEATGRVVAVEIAGASLDENQRIGVSLRDVRASASGEEFLFRSFPSATAGKVTLKAKFPIPQGVRKLEAMVWTFEQGESDKPTCTKNTAAEANTDNAADVILVDCQHLYVPEISAVPTPTPTPTPTPGQGG